MNAEKKNFKNNLNTKYKKNSTFKLVIIHVIKYRYFVLQ